MVLPVPNPEGNIPSRPKKPAVRRSRAHFGSPWLGYSIAALLVVLCAWGRMALVQGPRPTGPFLLFYPAIAIAAFIGGICPALAVIAGGSLFGFFVFPVFPGLPSWIVLAAFGGLFAFGFAFLRDIRDQTAAVAVESTKLRFVMERVSDWIFLVDVEGKIQYVNQTAASRLGFASGELPGRPLADLGADPRDGILSELLRRCMDGVLSPAEVMLKCRDGSFVLAEVICTPIRTGSSVVLHVAARDITERKQLDQKIREARQWDSLGALTGGLAHDFNNLLTTIMGNTSLVRDMLRQDDPAISLLESVETAGDRCAELIRLMLATAGYKPRNNQKLRIDTLVQEAIAAKPLPSGVEIRVNAEACEFESDRATIETLLHGLISNAAESYGATPGEVTLNVRLDRAPSLGEASFEEGEPGAGLYLGIVVEDKGCGMTPDIVESAFNPFFSTKLTGRGLGLPAVRGIVRAHSGVLWMRTEPGQGTRVEVWLPASGYHLGAAMAATI